MTQKKLTDEEKIALVVGILEHSKLALERSFDEMMEKYEAEMFESIKLDNPGDEE